MTPPARPPEERKPNPDKATYALARKTVVGWLDSLHPAVLAEIPPDDCGQLVDTLAWTLDAALATAHARGRAEGLEAAAQRVEASRFRPHEEEPNIVDSALNAAAAAIRALGGGGAAT